MKAILSVIRRKWAEYILEILVIIIGILGAFALDNWNEERSQKAQGKDYKRSVYKDLLNDIETLELKLDQLQTQYEGSLKSLQIIDDSNLLIDSADFMNSINDCIRNVILQRKENTIDQLRSNGQLHLIDDDSLIEELLQFYQFYDSRVENFNQLPNENRMELRKISGVAYNIDDIVEINRQYGDLNATFTPDIVQLESSTSFINTFLNHSSVRPLLVTIYFSSLNNVRWFRGLKEQAQAIISYMEETYPEILGIE
jgi:hypothetical protein